MAIIAKANGGNFEPIPPGNHLAMCYQLIDIGTQKGNWQGKETIRRVVRIVFELPNLKREFKPGDGERPYSVNKEYTLSLGKGAGLRKHLESWRGKAFTDEQLAGFDLKNILGKSCLLQISTNDKGYSEIQAITSVPQGMEKPDKTFNEYLYFDLEEFDENSFNKLPDFLKNKILDSVEYKNRMGHSVDTYNNPDDTVF